MVAPGPPTVVGISMVVLGPSNGSSWCSSGDSGSSNGSSGPTNFSYGPSMLLMRPV